MDTTATPGSTSGNCPECQGQLVTHESHGSFADISVRQCESCQGVFLRRADLGALIEAETDWHAHRSSHTTPMPRITADMTAPPPAAPRARSFIDALFKG